MRSFWVLAGLIATCFTLSEAKASSDQQLFLHCSGLTIVDDRSLPWSSNILIAGNGSWILAEGLSDQKISREGESSSEWVYKVKSGNVTTSITFDFNLLKFWGESVSDTGKTASSFGACFPISNPFRK